MMFDGDTFQRNGRTFRFKTEQDDDNEPPWKWSDGHGPVSEWRSSRYGEPKKAPGERVLVSDRGSIRTYDVQKATAIAKRDGWGLGDEDKAKLAKRLGREPTRGQIIAEAVERDFQYLRGWCTDDWTYVGVIVEHVETGTEESLWRIESDQYDYQVEVANELADQINYHLDTVMAEDIQSSRPDMMQGGVT